MAIDRVCTKFLTLVVLKLQRYQMDQYVHYWAHHTNLEVELWQQEHITNGHETNTLEGIFSEDLYDKMLIELAELLYDTSHTNIKELWRVSHIDQQKFHYIVLLDNAVHLKNEGVNSKHAISICNGQGFGIFEHELELTFLILIQFVAKMKKQLAEKEEHNIQSNDENDCGSLC
ncbi:hypothetical protein C2G38_2229600 [Gigaspora rosea]|uniref:Uncharacterized protein n=1 Tax=Gigaspora rosea TaxID=44941 RepID=A0A397TUW6_9GLOM|nr:hypothetical protein C2G38_2229600 [Gigaspora rosea]